jgi:quinol-cytochrome oxidoreductase complex cytochrome b subunit
MAYRPPRTPYWVVGLIAVLLLLAAFSLVGCAPCWTGEDGRRHCAFEKMGTVG